jgi:hypothetical protein
MNTRIEIGTILKPDARRSDIFSSIKVVSKLGNEWELEWTGIGGRISPGNTTWSEKDIREQLTIDEIYKVTQILKSYEESLLS